MVEQSLVMKQDFRVHNFQLEKCVSQVFLEFADRSPLLRKLPQSNRKNAPEYIFLLISKRNFQFWFTKANISLQRKKI